MTIFKSPLLLLALSVLAPSLGCVEDDSSDSFGSEHADTLGSTTVGDVRSEFGTFTFRELDETVSREFTCASAECELAISFQILAGAGQTTGAEALTMVIDGDGDNPSTLLYDVGSEPQESFGVNSTAWDAIRVTLSEGTHTISVISPRSEEAFVSWNALARSVPAVDDSLDSE